MRIKRLLSYIFIALPLNLAQPVQALPTNTAENIQLQRVIFHEINAYRMNRGLSALQLNSHISQEATLHSQNMAENKIPFSHDGYKQRMQRLFAELPEPRSYGENVAYTSKDARTVVQQWLDSSGHRRNIEGNFNLTGIGLAHAHGRVYVTQIFMRTGNN